MQPRIRDTGITLVYEPTDGSPIVDILLIHGLHGHPYKSWTSPRLSQRLVRGESPSTETLQNGQDKRSNVFRRAVTRLGLNSSKQSSPETGTSIHTASTKANDDDATIFWPADLLPQQCPRARILMYGYDSKITKYMSGAPSKNSLLSHSKDFLYSLSRERPANRPLILLAHSLGGIIVKEALACSSTSMDTDLQNIVESTSAVIFLGTPHRGSPELASLGEYLRSIISSFRMETTPAILDSLGLKTTDLQRAQEAFSRLWQKHDFRVKTFQEGLGLTGMHIGSLGNKVVPDYSSAIGDYREQAETLQANHKEMCRFRGVDDPNYRKVASEIRSIYHSIVELNARRIHQHGRIRRQASIRTDTLPDMNDPGTTLGVAQKAFIQALTFKNMFTRYRSLSRPNKGTASWLISHELYQDWFHDRNQEIHLGLLWLKGKPGAGKSVLMREAYQEAVRHKGEGEQCTAAFFFNAKGDELEHSPQGLLRSLLHQLLKKNDILLQEFCDQFDPVANFLEDTTIPLDESNLKDVFCSLFTGDFERNPTLKRTLIFIDALDECNADRIRDLAYWWRSLTEQSRQTGRPLSVCISSRHFPSITLRSCPEIVVEDHNDQDIITYVEKKFMLGISEAECQWRILRDKILEKASGVFLWAVLVVDEVLKKWDEGKDLGYLLRQVDIVPGALETLFMQILGNLDSREKQLSLRVFQWVIFATKPLRLHEWHHILAFLRTPPPNSLLEWRQSDYHTETDDQLERQIKGLSKGLLEVSKVRSAESDNMNIEAASVLAGAGSLVFDSGGTRFVQVVHESVREYFLQGNGFIALHTSPGWNPVAEGHLSIMETCIEYIKIKELDALVAARQAGNPSLGRNSLRDSPHESESSYAWPEVKSKSSQLGVPVESFSHCQDPAFQDSSPQKLTDRTSEDFPMSGYTQDNQTPISAIPQGTRTHTPLQIEFPNQNFSSSSKADVLSWLMSDDIHQDGIGCQVPASHSLSDGTTSISFSKSSRVLEDHPALLSYSMFEFFAHALKAQEVKANSSAVIAQLQRVWDRWVALKEDLPPKVLLKDYALNIGLSSWIPQLPTCPTDPNEMFPSKIDESHYDSFRPSHHVQRDSFRQRVESLPLPTPLPAPLPPPSYPPSLLPYEPHELAIPDRSTSPPSPLPPSFFIPPRVHPSPFPSTSPLPPLPPPRFYPSTLPSTSPPSSPLTSALSRYNDLVEATRMRAPKRQLSVASFSSAGSHTGSVSEVGCHSPIVAASSQPESPRSESPHESPPPRIPLPTIATRRRRKRIRRLPEISNISEARRSSKEMPTFLTCECCPSRPENFETDEELRAHMEEKKYCGDCKRRFRDKNQLQRHENSLHAPRSTWSCSNLLNHSHAFQVLEGTSSSAIYRCGYCGQDFPRRSECQSDNDMAGVYMEIDSEDQIRHLEKAHKWRECNAVKRFYRADHFRQHLKHSHNGVSGKWTSFLEDACMKEAEPREVMHNSN